MAADDKPRALEKANACTSAPAAVLVYATFPSREEALDVGRRMVEARVAGCVNVIPGMTSAYVWEGRTEMADEAVLIAKLPVAAAEAAVAFIAAHHSYETPAILVLPVIAGAASYLAWLASGVDVGA